MREYGDVRCRVLCREHRLVARVHASRESSVCLREDRARDRRVERVDIGPRVEHVGKVAQGLVGVIVVLGRAPRDLGEGDVRLLTKGERGLLGRRRPRGPGADDDDVAKACKPGGEESSASACGTVSCICGAC